MKRSKYNDYRNNPLKFSFYTNVNVNMMCSSVQKFEPHIISLYFAFIDPDFLAFLSVSFSVLIADIYRGMEA